MKKVFEEYNKQFTDRKSCVELIDYKPIKELLEQAHKEDREGIIVKDLNATYQHKRSNAWRKCKFFLETTIKICSYTENNKGIRAEDGIGNVVQIAGEQCNEVKQLLQSQKEVEIHLQYLEKTAEGRFRFPSYRGLVK